MPDPRRPLAVGDYSLKRLAVSTYSLVDHVRRVKIFLRIERTFLRIVAKER
jgi:hypothetical protein